LAKEKEASNEKNSTKKKPSNPEDKEKQVSLFSFK